MSTMTDLGPRPPIEPPLPFRINQASRIPTAPPAPPPTHRVFLVGQDVSLVTQGVWVCCAIACVVLGVAAVLSQNLTAILLAGFAFCYAVDRCLH